MLKRWSVVGMVFGSLGLACSGTCPFPWETASEWAAEVEWGVREQCADPVADGCILAGLTFDWVDCSQDVELVWLPPDWTETTLGCERENGHSLVQTLPEDCPDVVTPEWDVQLECHPGCK